MKSYPQRRLCFILLLSKLKIKIKEYYLKIKDLATIN